MSVRWLHELTRFLTGREAMSDPNAYVARLLERYEHQPILRGLVQLIPLNIGAAYESALLTKLNEYRAERLRTFFDELESGRIELSRDVIESEDFLHSYFATLRAVLSTRRRQKIRYLARLMKSAFSADRFESVDQYEELLAIVDDLSFRELVALSILAECETATPQEAIENELQRANKLWPAFEKKVADRLGISATDLSPLLTRLQRSGCYAEITGGYYDYTGGRGRLTSLYYAIAKLAGNFADISE